MPKKGSDVFHQNTKEANTPPTNGDRIRAMDDKELSAQLRRMSVETGSLMCLGCGYEHNCGIHGCALLRQAVETIENQAAALEDLKDHECSGLIEE